MKFPLSAHTARWLGRLEKGIEIGGSAHNPLGLPGVLNVDYTDDMDTIFKQEEIRMCGEALPVDIVDEGDSLIKIPYGSLDFIYSSHVIEHFPNLFDALLNWRQVLKNNGLIYAIVPQRDALAEDAVLPLTTYEHCLSDFVHGQTVETHPLEPGHGKRGHYHRFTSQSLADMVDRFGQDHVGYPQDSKKPAFKVVDIEDPDSKVGNGFAIVIRCFK